MRKGNKWEPLWELFEAGVFVDYEYVWLPDDDLDTDWATINKLFRVAKAVGLELAQPALTPDSYIAHPIVRQVPGTLLRFTNFVELMAPLFSQSALGKCAYTFRGNKSAWGVDYAWTAILGRPENKIAIIDAVPVKHTRPVGQAYDVDAAVGEMNANLEKYGAAHEAHEIARVPLDVLGQRGIAAAPLGDESAATVATLGICVDVSSMPCFGLRPRGRAVRRRRCDARAPARRGDGFGQLRRDRNELGA